MSRSNCDRLKKIRNKILRKKDEEKCRFMDRKRVFTTKKSTSLAEKIQVLQVNQGLNKKYKMFSCLIKT